MRTGRRSLPAGVACLMLAAAVTLSAQDKSKDKDSGDKEKDKRPKLTLTARPPIAMSPARVVAHGRTGRRPRRPRRLLLPDDRVGLGRRHAVRKPPSDCDPYEAGKSTFKRRFTVEHVFRAGYHRVSLRLKKHDKQISSATVVVDVRPGIRDL